MFGNVVVTSHSSCVFLYLFSSANISPVRFVLPLQDWWCVGKRETSFSSFSELLSFVTNSPVAGESLSGSTDVGLFVSKAWYSFARLFGLFLVASKRLISFITICDRISSCVGNSFVVLTPQGLLEFCAVISNGWLNFQCLKHLFLYNGAQIALACLLSLIVWEVTISFWVSLTTNFFKLNTYD